jgi:hypothetical protein
MLTAPAVAKLKSAEKRREIPDGSVRGLYLVIQPSGAKSWVVRYHRNGAATAKLTLGTVDTTGTELEDDPAIGGHLTLAAARQLATKIHREAAIPRTRRAARGRPGAPQRRSGLPPGSLSRSTSGRRRAAGGRRRGHSGSIPPRSTRLPVASRRGGATDPWRKFQEVTSTASSMRPADAGYRGSGGRTRNRARLAPARSLPPSR